MYFMENVHSHNRKLSFHLSRVNIPGSMEFGKTKNYFFHDNAPNIYIRLHIYYAETISETTSIEIQSQHWGINRQLSIEYIAVEYFNNSINPDSNEKSEFH